MRKARVRLAVSLAVASGLLVPVSASAVTTPVGPELPVSDPVFGARPGDQSNGAVAFSGTDYLLVWQDNSSGNLDLYGTRVSPTGQVLDGHGFLVASGPGHQLNVSVAWNGTHFLVVWADSRSGAGYQVFGARVTPAGSVVETAGFAISQPPGYRPQVASNGTDFLVVWQTSSTSGDVSGSRVSGAGVVMDPSGLAIGPNPEGEQNVAVASDGSDYVVTWMRSLSPQTVMTRSVDASGSLGVPSGLVAGFTGYPGSPPRLAWNGESYLAAWTGTSGTTTTTRYFRAARLDPSGAQLGSIMTLGTSTSVAWSRPVVESIGSVFFVGYNYTFGSGFIQSDLKLAIIQGDGTVTATGLPVSGGESNSGEPDMATDGSTILAVWHDSRSGSSDVYGMRLSSDGVRLHDPAGLLFSHVENNMVNPAVGFDGTNFLVAWEDYRNGTLADIYVGRVSPAGQMIDGTGVPVHLATFRQILPRLAFDGSTFLLVWTDYKTSSRYEATGMRIQTDGESIELLDPAPFSISGASPAPNAAFPDVAWGGGTFMVAYLAQPTGPYQIRAAAVSSGGSVAPSVLLHPATNHTRQRQRLAWTGSSFLAAWQDTRNGGQDVYGTRIDPAGVVLDPANIPIATGAAVQEYPSVASNGTNALVVWQEITPLNTDVFGVRVTQAGTIIAPPLTVSSAVFDQTRPAVSVVGSHYFVAWMDARSDTNSDVFGTRVDSNGDVRTPDGVAISVDLVDETAPAVGVGGGAVAVIYQRDVGVPGFTRAFMRTFDVVNTAITSGPSPITSSRSASFTLESSEPNPSFECKLDAGSFLPCTTPHHIEVSEGAHTLQARAVDTGIADPTPASWSWLVDSTPPLVRFLRPVPGIYRDDALLLEAPLPLPVLIGPTTIEIHRSDDRTQVVEFAVTITDALSQTTIPTPQVTCGPEPVTTCRFIFDPQFPGIFDIEARATNEAGLQNAARIRVIALSQITLPSTVNVDQSLR